MSVQFGRWNFDGKPLETDYLDKVKSALSPYAPDGNGEYVGCGVTMIFGAFHTNKESRREVQPFISPSGTVICWDGRLDNRKDLVSALRYRTAPASSDAAIACAAYDQWGEDCFPKLIGDWAASIWNPLTRALILAKDFLGPRHLYYSADANCVTWCTVLDPLVQLEDRLFQLNEEYIAGWFSFFPATHLTPYTGILAVPPSSLALFRNGQTKVRKYWDFDGSKRIRCSSDAEYEEHFRAAFGLAVERRIRSDCPVLAELSGGMDSSSIVCMADKILTAGNAETSEIETISYYDDSEPNWNERPFFERVEQQRGRTGCHINVAIYNTALPRVNNESLEVTPGASERSVGEFADLVTSHNNRVLLSGIGGDESTGGVPTPTPELEDLLAGVKLRSLAHQLKVWALEKRKPWFHLLFDAVRGFFPPALVGVPEYRKPPVWLNPSFVRRNRRALRGYESRLKFFGPRPTFQENLSTLEVLRRQLHCSPLPFQPPYEKCYPYLDRDFLEFMYAIPREQLVRPGQRRSLMRRALAGIVPDEIRNRRRKASVSRAPMVAIGAEWNFYVEVTQHMLSEALGIVDAATFATILQKARNGQEVPIVTMNRTIGMEMWFQNLKAWNLLPTTVGAQGSPSNGVRRTHPAASNVQ